MKSYDALHIGRARAEYAGHVLKDRISRSFDIRRADGSSLFAYSLTWTPGSLALAGDVGELVLTHHHALRQLETGLAWATSSDHHYLLSKSSAVRVFDREGTVEELVRGAVESPRLRQKLRDLLNVEPRVRLRGAALYSVIRRELHREFEDFGRERAGEWIWDLGHFDDWFGQDHYDAQALFQIEAIRHGARLALDHLAADREAAA